jgi:hypothetical protein
MLGASVGMSALLAKTDRLALALANVTAYPNGFTFDLVIVGNPMTRDPREQGFPMIGHPRMRRGPRIGFEFADGTRASEGGPMPFAGATLTMRSSRDDSGVPTRPVLMGQGGGGGNRSYAMRMWCFPLPPAGRMDVYVEWSDAGIEETKRTLDATPIVDAAPRAVTLWDFDEEEERAVPSG